MVLAIGDGRGEPVDEDAPFSGFAGALGAPSAFRAAIRAAIRRPETECVPPLIEAASLDAETSIRVSAIARRLVEGLRAQGTGRGVQGMIQEYSLSSEEGVALMCLAEALQRIPDDATRDALIRDKVSRGDWRAHLGPERTLFVNAATWGLMVTGRLTAAMPEEGLARALGRLIAGGGEPIIRAGVDMAMRLMGEQFVAGQTIGEALANSRKMERRGYLYSYDMLGEAAVTAEDAARYLGAYEDAIDAIGKASAGRGPIGGPGISIKLSALHPRYRRSQLDRVVMELLPRLKQLALRAKSHGIGLNIDAEESDRLDISLDLLEALCFDPELSGWDGIGFVVQAYGKRCVYVVDWLIDLAKRSGHRLMVRLVKGAYWDSEIKQAQVDGLSDYPVFTRKVHSDVSYLASAKRLLAAPNEIFPQFATHNAQTVAAIHAMAGPDFRPGQYEFQCLHGMGEALYAHVVGDGNLDRPCRIYAPVGTHGTLLAYLVRRLLENGANSSFVNRIGDKLVSIDELVADPVAVAKSIAPLGAPHPQIALPDAILGGRRNSAGLDLADETELAGLGEALKAKAHRLWTAGPILAEGVETAAGAGIPLANPADRNDLVGTARFASPELVGRAFAAAMPGWAPAVERSRVLHAAADLLQSRMRDIVGLIMREAGKSASNAVAEVREAVDFLRYYGDEAVRVGGDGAPLGTVGCISPWNFPLSIFTGQIAASLAAGNAVIAKPADETPLIAAAMVALLHEAGIPTTALQFLPGGGVVGAALCAHPDAAAVVFTGSTEVARLIQRQLANRVSAAGLPVPFIAETGGINAMIVDSSALTEQVVADVVSSAFDSAGQRCSALRLLCLQDDIAERTIDMLKGAMRELRTGNPDRLSTDVGPVITTEAADRINAHIEAMRVAGHRITQAPLDDGTHDGIFVPPTLIELEHIGALRHEVFGPVLHVIAYARRDLDRTIDAINALGYGLTFGLHTRLDETIDRVTSRVGAGNIYVNRNIIGAMVGVQPFGGHGLSGTGPKAGGPLYVRRLMARRPAGSASRDDILPGPAGESNSYRTMPRGEILLLPLTREGLSLQLDAVITTGNRAVIDLGVVGEAAIAGMAPSGARFTADWTAETAVDGVLVEGGAARMIEVLRVVAGVSGKIVPVMGSGDINMDMLVHEVSISINTAAAGGNVSLMALKES
ncbi:MAG: bifunctional proline dehydrogenase/L-glutamate gamma-semialdehyde dehydrogenase PutA [Devosia nanyangense]|uniref:Bifunctional protein PutA n=1 Tax=Devosia nanyangense TaxID=1228055 RepID=A0A933NYN6_9HYPH|nr:bifunctional proline dehydrogenase/L-glutamate gamma-semialdehyde dehydrogenase PutA [Devosia nanyangense]